MRYWNSASLEQELHRTGEIPLSFFQEQKQGRMHGDLNPQLINTSHSLITPGSSHRPWFLTSPLNVTLHNATILQALAKRYSQTEYRKLIVYRL